MDAGRREDGGGYRNEGEMTVTGVDASTIRAILIAATRVDGSAKATAIKLSVSPQYLSDVIQGRRAVSSVLAGRLGYRQVTLFVPIEDQE